MQVLPIQGTMPPFQNLFKFAPKAQSSQALSNRTSYKCNQQRQSNRALPPAGLLTAAETVSRCFATPSIHAPVWLYGVQQGTTFFEGSETIGVIAEKALAGLGIGGTSLSFTRVTAIHGGLGRRGSDNNGDKDPLRRSSAGLPHIHRSFAFHFYQAPWADIPTTSDLYARALHAASESHEIAAQPGLIACARSEDESGGQTEVENREPTATTGILRFNSGASCLPHPDKVKKGGEDAHFICSDISAVGVADGVGGWADVGVDAGLYARELMMESAKALAEEPEVWVKPRMALKKAHSFTKSRGSSTACIIVLADDRLHAANLGDSGFVVIRNGRTVFKSPPQQHDFNFPYQLGSQGCDPPDMAEEFALPVAAGDILVVGTDGLFDNLFDSELNSVVMHSTKAGRGPQDTAERVATLAHLRAQDPLRQSPFARAAQEAGYRFMGGKMDDITVVVSYITQKDEKSTQ